MAQTGDSGPAESPSGEIGDGSGFSQHPAGQAVIAVVQLSELTVVRREIGSRPEFSPDYGPSRHAFGSRRVS